MGRSDSNGLAIASLVLGIVSILGIWASWAIGIPAAVVGLILGIMARKQNPSSMATAGIVLSIIALILSAVVMVACVSCFGCFSFKILMT